MKQFVCMVSAWWMVVSAFAQTVTYQTLQLTTNKTTTLVFPSAVKRGDIGAKDILAQQVKENENLLFLKAAKAGFTETNLNVITDDGRLYTFTVVYDSMPDKTVYNIPASSAMNRNRVLFPGHAMNPAVMKKHAKQILDAKGITHGVRDKSWDMIAKVKGIYIKENVVFFQIEFVNNSTISYDIDFIRFYITDNKTAKRTASQEPEIKPLCNAGYQPQISANSKAVVVFAFEKFTIPDAKSFIIQVGEKNGGRHLELKVKNNKIINAFPIARNS